MKKSIFLSAAGLLMGLGVSMTASAAPKKHHDMNNNAMMSNQQVSIIPLKHEPGFAVMVVKEIPSRSVVIVTSPDDNVVFKDVLTDGTRAEKKYNLSQLDAGNYTVEVYAKGHDVKTNFYVYNKSRGKVIYVQ
jgi:hypothetical protein